MKKGSSLEGLEGELVSLGEQKLISSNNNLSLTNNSFVFSKQLLDSLDQDKEYYLTIRFERLELPVDYNHTIVLGYAIDKKSSSAEAMVVIPHSKKRSFYYDKNTIGPVLVRGPEVVHAAIQEIELSVLAKILESQGDHVPFGKHE